MIFQFKRQKIVRIKQAVLAGHWEGRTQRRKKKVTRQTSIIFFVWGLIFPCKDSFQIFCKQNPIQYKLKSCFSFSSLAATQACVSASHSAPAPVACSAISFACPQAKQILVVGEELFGLPGFNDSKDTFKARTRACITLPRTWGWTVQA